MMVVDIGEISGWMGKINKEAGREGGRRKKIYG
jgi:hypothetical protein